MKGPDVEEAQRLLADNPFGHFDPGDVDGEFGPTTATATKDAKWLLGYPDSNCDEVFGTRLRDFLAGTEKLPADFANRREARKHGAVGDAHIREKIVEYALWGCHNEPQIHYKQSRPIDGLDHPKKLPLNTDCSGFATDCYKWAGGPDPNGRAFSGAGWTGDMMSHGKSVAKSALKPGDLVLYGGAPAHQHVCIVVETGADPMLVSHGQEKGPFEVSLSKESEAHAGQPVILRSYLH
jgi:cell wall-associated NlpC family hydrolase